MGEQMRLNKKMLFALGLLFSLQNIEVHAINPAFDPAFWSKKLCKKAAELIEKTPEIFANSFSSGAGLVATLFATAFISAKITRIQEAYLFPAVTLEYTGGLSSVFGAEQAKLSLKRLISQINHPDSFASKGIKPVSGVLLYGPPGTGKTLLARAVAQEVECEFIYAASSELTTVRAIQVLFENAHRKARKTGKPCIIFIDEIDLVATCRNNSDAYATAMATNQLLAEMDGFNQSKDRVIVIAATNNAQALDPAITRAGRLELLIEVPAFDEKARKEFLLACIDQITGLQFDNEFVEHAVENTHGYGGAQLISVVQGSARIAVAEMKETVDLECFKKYHATSKIFTHEQPVLVAA
jgi:ATP-dependent 26S proteasome regulatory subunit